METISIWTYGDYVDEMAQLRDVLSLQTEVVSWT
jgi:hypothetical protein